MADRDSGGRFLPGNGYGRPAGSVSTEKRSLAAVCRELVEGSEDVFFVMREGRGRNAEEKRVGLLELVTARVGKAKNTAMGLAVQVEFLKLVMAYGWGKPPVKVVLGDEDDSPDAVLRAVMARRNAQLAEKDAGAGGAAHQEAADGTGKT